MRFLEQLRHPIRSLDRWWYVQAPAHRLDRGPMYLCVMIPTFLYSCSILLLGPVPSSAVDELPTWIQYLLALGICTGTFTCLWASTLGSKMLKPRFDVRRAYRIGYSAAPITAMSLFAYGWAVVNDTPNWPSAFGGLVGPFIGLGALLNALGFWLEVRRLNRVMDQAVLDRKANCGGGDDG